MRARLRVNPNNFWRKPRLPSLTQFTFEVDDSSVIPPEPLPEAFMSVMTIIPSVTQGVDTNERCIGHSFIEVAGRYYMYAMLGSAHPTKVATLSVKDREGNVLGTLTTAGETGQIGPTDEFSVGANVFISFWARSQDVQTSWRCEAIALRR